MTTRHTAGPLRPLPFSFAVLLVSVASGCQPELGPCDPFAAREVVYFQDEEPTSFRNGEPMFAGQALVHVSCGAGSFCHSSAAEVSTGERFGVPLGLDFDLAVPCGPDGCSPEELEAFRRRQNAVFDHRFDVLRTIERGSMPPGGVGEGIRADGGNYVRLDTSGDFYAGGVEGGEPLPAIDSAEGRAILKNWLSCGLPVVERYADPDTPQQAGQTCRGSTDCIFRAPANAEPPEPYWPSIFETFIDPFCGRSCHGPGEPDFREESQLDLSEIDLAYDALINVRAAGDECGGVGTLVVPGDSAASLLIDKLLDDPNDEICGDPMPSGSDLPPADWVAAVEQWINDGATADPAPEPTGDM